MSDPRPPLVGAAWLQLRHRVFAADYDRLVAEAGFSAGASVLDAGCGAGTHLRALRRAVGDDGAVSGVDVSPENVAAAAGESDAAGRGYERLEVASLTALPYSDHCFDGVWCANVLQYLDDDDAMIALQEMLRVLRPGGVLAVKDSDMLLWRLHPGDPLLLHRLIAAQQRTAGAVPSTRGRLLRRWLERAGAQAVQQRTVLLERWAPLSDDEFRMCEQWLAELASVAERCPLSAADHATWERLAAGADATHPLRAPDLYICEGQTLATGRRS